MRVSPLSTRRGGEQRGEWPLAQGQDSIAPHSRGRLARRHGTLRCVWARQAGEGSESEVAHTSRCTTPSPTATRPLLHPPSGASECLSRVRCQLEPQRLWEHCNEAIRGLSCKQSMKVIELLDHSLLPMRPKRHEVALAKRGARGAGRRGGARMVHRRAVLAPLHSFSSFGSAACSATGMHATAERM